MDKMHLVQIFTRIVKKQGKPAAHPYGIYSLNEV
jgi:uncharacterized protein (DUF1810 family)